MMIIDAGVHVWRPQSPDRPWMPGRKAHLPEPLTYEKFSTMMKEAGVEHAILVPSWSSNGVTRMPEMPVNAFLSFGSMAAMACLFAS
jgi:hypothetical protein